MQPIAPDLRRQLRSVGLSGQVIEAVWPEWWNDEAERSLSAQAELRFTVARRLGLSPSSLFEDGPRFVWRDDARFKNLGDVTELEQSVLSSFGLALGRVLIAGTPSQTVVGEPSASTLRSAILAGSANVGLLQLLALSWGLGIPVVRTTVFPLPQKRMHAMSVRHGERFAIILGLESKFEARIAFTLAHELAHVFLGHMRGASTLLDYQDPFVVDSDDEERAADAFALEVLTGSSSPEIIPEIENFNATQLANAAREAGAVHGIDPGIIALCVGHATKRWEAATGALKVLGEKEDLAGAINAVANHHLEWDQMSMGSASYVEKMLGVLHEH